MTQVDFTSYQPPGIYVEDDTSPIVSIVGSAGPAVVGIVGPSIGYKLGHEVVQLNGTTPVLLSELGIDPSTVVVSDLVGSVFAGSTYSLTVGGGADGNIGTTGDNTLTIVRNGSTIPDGAQVFITYRFTDFTYFDPKLFTNYEDVRDTYGVSVDPVTSVIVSPLSLAAQMAFQNGARQVMCVASAGSATSVTRSQLATALAKLENQVVDLVVTLPVGITGTPGSPGDVINVTTDLSNHCTNMSTINNLYRVGIIGHEITSTVVPSTEATTINSKRIMLAWPNQMSFFNGVANQTILISGYYLAAAYAGIFAGLSARDGITKKTVRGFSGIPTTVLNTMSMATKNAYSAAGVAVTERTRNGNLICRHGTTTDVTSINHREMSLVRVQDALVNSAYTTIESAQLIGSPIDAETEARLKGVITGVLESAKTAGVIVAYSNVSVRQQQIDPTVVEIKFQYLPPFPMNYIVLAFSINLNSGATDLFSQPA